MNLGDQFCRACGRQVLTVAGGAIAVDSAAPVVQAGPSETSGKAIASLIFGLLFFIPLAFIAAILFGHLGLSEIGKSAGRLKGRGMAIAGLILGYGWIVGIPVILIIAAIAIPNLLRARMAANESSAVSSIRTINAAEIAYSASHPESGYTCSLPDLSTQIDNELASGTKHGYVFELSGCTPGSETPAIAKYQLIAYPVNANQTGVRAFCTDESAAVKVDTQGSAQNCLQSGLSLQ
jgi:type II secretory pathway pseudopilin PulG